MGLWLVSATLRCSMSLSGLQVALQPLGLVDQRWRESLHGLQVVCGAQCPYRGCGLLCSL
ncbi:hypothetical protein DPMN_186087 [Dreissena polymorpha]|uniref:Uncharacterized protein n=1 Tax=Dreissena polymorpha TaxID=45954 RepID=A0A9D4I683_DREPO|nr:hypothetical protein DPMN_186087 [Dreissena polymorpha]